MSNTNLPPGWVKIVDPLSGQTYYANTITRETRWDPPPPSLPPPPPPPLPRQQFASANNNNHPMSNNSGAGGPNNTRSYTNSGNLAKGVPNILFDSSINYSSGVNTNGNMNRKAHGILVNTSVSTNNNGKMQTNNPYANTHNQGMNNNTARQRISLDNNVRDNNDNSKKKRVVHNPYDKSLTTNEAYNNNPRGNPPGGNHSGFSGNNHGWGMRGYANANAKENKANHQEGMCC